MINYNYANDVKNRVTVRDACERYGLGISPTGFSICPFHSEKTPSCKVNFKDGGFHCFGCGKHGDVIDFVGGLFNIPFREAEKKINDDFGLGLPIGQKISDEEKARLDELSRKITLQNAERARVRENLFSTYLEALGKWVWLDRIKRENKPKDPDHVNFLYVYACQRIEQAKFEVQCAEIDLFKFDAAEKERRQNATITNSRFYGG